MKIQTLNGEWLYRIGYGAERPVQVPFSALAVGHSECRRYFDLEHVSERVFLQFDGIAYAGRAYLNGVLLGEMLPYSEYRFDVTEGVRLRGNELRVELEDFSPAFGPTAGWENYGGIIRDVSLVCLPDNHITDVFAHSALSDDYKSAVLTVEAACVDRANSMFDIRLLDGAREVLSYCQPAGENAAIRVDDVELWSPDNPRLYRLIVSLRQEGRILDERQLEIGFRQLTCDRHRFYLNGQPIFLAGVCKHEMIAGSGHCPTAEQIEADLRAIKATGCNFVRLVHYPHNKKTLELADRIGLMVSEEPGLWWSDTADERVSSGSLEVLRRTILRDRSHACVAFWLCFNECRFTEQFLLDSAAVCRRYDPTRMVSGANCMSDADTKKYYNLCGFDFYTMHPYSPTFDRAGSCARILNDKPLLFTEWGGYHVYDNPHLLMDFLAEMNRLYMDASDDGALAGAFFWCWAELNDFNRGRPACIDGNLSEGLMTADRQPTLIYDAFCRAIRRMGQPEEDAPFWIQPVLSALPDETARNVLPASLSDGFLEYMASLAAAEREKPSMRFRVLKRGPVIEGVSALNACPLVLCDGTAVTLDCDIHARSITLYGLCSLKKGYPLQGEYGEEAAFVELRFADGACQTVPLCNGVEITTAFALYQSSRINPVAERARRAALFGYEKNFEQYVMNALTVELENASGLRQIRLRSSGCGYDVLLYGILY